MDKSDYGILQFLMEHAKEKPVSFHMPGHKGSRFYRKNGFGKFMKNIADYDITEIPGADNLFQMESIIKETSERYADLYGVDKSYLLVNGTSGGLIASILATVPRGGKLIMARNCHKSVFNAVQMGGIEPIYAYPEVVKGYGIAGAVSPEEIEGILRMYPEAYAVLVTSPNYYGICSNIHKIAKIVHKYNKVLIVDQAHGAHLKFFGKNMPESAEEAGADIVVNSIHKTLGSFTQSAVLNVNSNRVDLALLEDKLQAIESSSPSYLLMASLDINAQILEKKGRRLCAEWKRNLNWFYKKAEAIPEVRIMNIKNVRRSKINGKLSKLPVVKDTDFARKMTKEPEVIMDTTKINIDMSAFRIDGSRLEEMLNEHGIYPELSTGNLVMCMSGIGNTRKDFKKLYKALAAIAYENRFSLIKLYNANEIGMEEREMLESGMEGESLEILHQELQEEEERRDREMLSWARIRPLYKIPTERCWMPIEDCVGRICAGAIIPYPPGIPYVCPGEEISYEDIEYIITLRQRGDKVIGISDDNQIQVGI